MKRLIQTLVFVAILPVVPPLAAQAVLVDTRFNPPKFFVGDHVEMTLEFELESPLSVELPEIMPESTWVEIRDIRTQLEDNRLTVVVAFTPFAAGTRALPTMELGALQLHDVKVPTYSILENAHEGTRALRGQLLLPGTHLAVALILALVAMAPFLVYGMSRLIWKWFRKFRDLFRNGRPARRFRRLLKKLNTSVDTKSAVPWFSELTDGLRLYMSTRTGRDCRTSTTAEIALMQEFRGAQTPQGRLVEVLRHGDMVKFAGRFADDQSLRNTLRNVETAVAQWEKTDVQHQ